MSTSDWHSDAFPELRAEPPWVMQEMIAAEPAVVERLLSDPPAHTRAVADAIASALDRHQPVTVCGCGTSEHAAHAIAALVGAAAGAGHAHLIRGRPALEAALDPCSGVCVGVSHDGGTRATALALEAARAAGASTVAITQVPDGSVARAAERTLITPRHDDSWCHTIAYTSAIGAGAALAVRVGSLQAEARRAAELLERVAAAAGTAPIAAALAGRRVVLCAGADIDHISARELALKIAEGARMPTIALELETVLHGQLAGHEPADALILVAIADHRDRDRVIRRATHLCRAAGEIGLPVAGLLSESYAGALIADLTPAGRLVVDLPSADRLDPRLAALLAGAGALQCLTLELAHARRTNPDLIRREEPAYRSAAAVAERSTDW